MTNLKLVSIDRRALEPLSPVKPKKALILVGSLIAGLLFGMLLALARQFALSRRETKAVAPLASRAETQE